MISLSSPVNVNILKFLTPVFSARCAYVHTAGTVYFDTGSAACLYLRFLLKSVSAPIVEPESD